MELARAAQIKLGIRIEVITVIWMTIEMAVSLAAGLAAHSFLLTAFGLDSLIELVSGGILLWRLQVEARGDQLLRVEDAERRAAKFVAIMLGLLCGYVAVSAMYGLVVHSRPESSVAGLAVTSAAVVLMPYLAVTKRRISKAIDSAALAADAVNSITCGFMAGTVLLGLGLTLLFGWWWAESAAAVLFLVWLVRETLEAFEEARQSG
jgi:divalent metal cation (Fe/Co/Zn/Cd) transporter